MKKKILALLGFCMAVCLTVGVAACSPTPPVDTGSGSQNSSDIGGGSDGSNDESSGGSDSSDSGSNSGSVTPEEPKFVDWQTGDGVSFSPHGVTYELPAFEAMPRAYEAWLRVPTTQTGSAGVIFGNNTDRTTSGVLAVGVKENGVPYVSVNGKSVAFTEVDVRSDEFVHLAICLDKNNQTGKCYLNGELAQTLTEVSLGDIVTNDPFRVGGDFASGMPNIFQGEIKSVAFYKDIRVSREVEEDLFGVETTDENLLGAYDFNAVETGATVVTDLGKQANHLKIEKVWLDETESVDEFDYSFAVVGDTQYIVDLDPERLTDIYDWILENQVSQKIEYVMGLGDIVQHLYYEDGINLAAEWQYAREAIGKLGGKIGYSLVRGNHDGSMFFNETFGTDVYLSGVDGMYQKIENTYRTFVAGGYQYLVLTLDYQPSADVLAWANEVVAAYPNHRVIVTTHSYIKSDASYTTTYDGGASTGGKVGQIIWEDFAAKHANVMMVLCGHESWDDIIVRQDKGENGNVVTQMLIDPQNVDLNGATGMVAMLYFSENGEKMQVRYYSTTRGQYLREVNQFDLDLGEYANIGVVDGDTEKPKIKTVGVQTGVAGCEYTLPTILVTDNSGETLTPSVKVYKKGDENKTSVAVTGGKFTPTTGGVYVLEITAVDSANNSALYTVELPIRDTALAANVLEDFGNEATLMHFTGGAEAEWLSSYQGASGVLHLSPNNTEKSYYAFRLFDLLGDYGLPFNKITMRVWVDAGKNEKDEWLSTSFYDTYQGKWKGFGNSTPKGESGWYEVVFTDFYNWEYFSESMKESNGGQLFWTWTKNTHIYIDEITFDAKQEIELSVDKETYMKGDVVTISTSLVNDPLRALYISVTSPSGKPITVENGAFTMTEAGVYTVQSELLSPAYYANSVTITVEALVEHIRMTNAESKYATGSVITVPNGEYFNPKTGETIDAVISYAVAFNGSAVTVDGNGAFTAAKAGVYTVTYTATVDGEEVRTDSYSLLVSDKMMEFEREEMASNAKTAVQGAEWLETFEGATGVVKLTLKDDIWGGYTFDIGLTEDELKNTEWDFIELRVWFTKVSSGASNPDVYESYWNIVTPYQWDVLTLSKEQLIAQFGSIEETYKALTGKTRLFRVWNTENTVAYFDYVHLGKNYVTTLSSFDTADSTAVCLNGQEKSAGGTYTGTQATWLESYQGATGVLKTNCGSSASNGYWFTFNGLVTEAQLLETVWEYMEIKFYFDTTGVVWMAYHNDLPNNGVEGGKWVTFKITREWIETRVETANLNAFAKGLASEDGFKLFFAWTSANVDVYFDSIRLIGTK